MWISAGPAGNGFATVNVAVSAARSSATFARCVCGAGADGHLFEIDLGRVQHDPVRGLIGPDANRFGPLEPFSGDVHDERQIVVLGCRGWRETLGTNGRRKEQQEQERYAQGNHPPAKPHKFSVP